MSANTKKVAEKEFFNDANLQKLWSIQDVDEAKKFALACVAAKPAAKPENIRRATDAITNARKTSDVWTVAWNFSSSAHGDKVFRSGRRY